VGTEKDTSSKAWEELGELFDRIEDERLQREAIPLPRPDPVRVLGTVNAIRTARKLDPLGGLELEEAGRPAAVASVAKWVEGWVYPGDGAAYRGALSFPTRKEAAAVARRLERFDLTYPRNSPMRNVQYEGWYIDIPPVLESVIHGLEQGELEPDTLAVGPVVEPHPLSGSATEPDDFEIGARLRRWAELRERDGKPAHKRASSLLGAFGWQRLTRSVRKELDEILAEVGLEARPSILLCSRDEWLRLSSVGEPILSTASPSQLITYHPHSWSGEDMGHYGQWLRCLKDTRRGDRQLLWSEDSIAGIVTFGGWIRQGYKGMYEGWGSIHRLKAPVSRTRLLDDDRTAGRFDAHGIKALQGNSIALEARLANALTELTRIGPTRIPLNEPDDAKPILWTGLHGLAPEASIETAVATRKSLWKRLGFRSTPARQRRLGSAGRVDLIDGGVVGEAKRAVTLRDGPDQIERYLRYLEAAEGRNRSATKGLLLQCAQKANPTVVQRVHDSDFRLELWSVYTDERSRRWKLKRLA
jgi:hypothetical protein